MEKLLVAIGHKHERNGCLIEDILNERQHLGHRSLHLRSLRHKFDYKVERLESNKVSFALEHELQM